MGVSEIGKKAGERCQHLGDSGCTIYETRPESCRLYSCQWMHGYGRHMERPDRVGFFLNSEATGKCLVAHEAREGAFKERSTQDALVKLGKRYPLVLNPVLFPGTDVPAQR